MTRARWAWVAALLLAIAVPWAWMIRSEEQVKAGTVDEAGIDALAGRCMAQMVKDTCRVLKTSLPGQPSARLFIAGIGEVDAEAFTRLRSFGDRMCQEVRQQCRADPAGANCRVARALYPLVAP